MKKILPVILLLAVLGIFFFVVRGKDPASLVDSAPVNDPVAQQTSELAPVDESPLIIDEGAYSLDTQNSTISWTGSKFVGASHSGNLNLLSGNVVVGSDNNVSSGEAVIDMASMATEEAGGEGLIQHLMSDHFFEVETYPEAKIILSEVRVDNATSLPVTLTIKGVSNEILLPVNIVSNDSGISVTGTTSIDRTKWDVKFGSGVIGVAQDKAIKDEIDIQLNLVFISNS